MKYILLLIVFIPGLFLNAQHDQHCGTDQIMDAHYRKHPELKQKQLQQMQTMVSRIKNKQEINAASYTIPIVFHILHLGGPENISDAQVIDGLRILNRDFAKQNPDTIEIIPSFKPLADSMQIQFALPTIDPNGNCTNGIIHHYDAATDWSDSEFPNYTWDPTRYLNVYIVRSITLSSGFGAAGYTYFPGTWPDGDPMDAIFMLNNYFGTFGTGNAFTSRVLTHEVGHWLGLYHVFGWNPAALDCNNDDFIFDTPTTPGYVSCPDANDPASYQICTPGVDENFQNYMDYSYCVRMFTQEQGAAMRACLQSSVSARDNLSSAANLVSTGVITPQTCAPEADFFASRYIVCTGTPVTFYDASQNGTPTSYTWTLSGATPSVSNSAAPTVMYATPGVYSVTYVSANSTGTSAPITKSSLITVTGNTAMYQSLWGDGFESNSFNTEWREYSSSGGSHWTVTTDGFFSGTHSAVIPYPSNTRNMRTAMETPSINMNFYSHPHLNYMYAGQETSMDHVNSLRVYITTDCGDTWAMIDSLGGMDLATAGIGPQGYLAVEQTEWVHRSIDITSFSFFSHAYFKFLYTRDTISAANNFYIDHINMTDPLSLKETAGFSFSVYPNPTGGEISITINGAVQQVYITDVLGRTIEKQDVNARGQKLYMLGNKPEPGIYFVHAQSGPREFVKKIIIK
ncbi:MAG: hypothetical protein K0S33_807 [Bacteroidetes bacterium]|jgi:hypothetical protein|nr:hypothetical protein [Bacteroidota bacterium]